MLPKDFPPWQTVSRWFRRFVRLMLFRTLRDIAVMVDRERAGRKAGPSAGVIDSQTVKAQAAKAKRGYDDAAPARVLRRGPIFDIGGCPPSRIADIAAAGSLLFRRISH